MIEKSADPSLSGETVGRRCGVDWRAREKGEAVGEEWD